MSAPAGFDEDTFFERFKRRFPAGHMGDDIRGDKMALVVVDDVPVEVQLPAPLLHDCFLSTALTKLPDHQ